MSCREGENAPLLLARVFCYACRKISRFLTSALISPRGSLVVFLCRNTWGNVFSPRIPFPSLRQPEYVESTFGLALILQHG